MFDPFNPGASPFSNAFEGGGHRAFAGREDQMERQKLALERAREKKRELLDNEYDHAEKMSKQFKMPYQPKENWVASATNAATAALGIAKEQGLFQPRNNNNASPFNMNAIDQLGKNPEWKKIDIGSPSSWGFDASKAFRP